MSDLVSGLNPAQREAVLHGDGPLLILAGAGSGKTRVLTHRAALLIGERHVAPWRILAITFTNKAAGELRERLQSLVGPEAGAIWTGTFHSTCVKILRRESDIVGYRRDFVIYDADDQLRLIRACLNDENIDPKRVPPRAVAAVISDGKSKMLDAQDLVARAASYRDEEIARVAVRYADRLRANQAMDFDDLLMLAVRLLEEDAAARARWQGRFQHVMVDEYQDTNHAQYRLVRVLAEPERNLVVVGDDDQGIYSWRGADVRNILDFERDYPEAHVVALEQNYRSTGTILRAANAVVANNRGRHPKRLWTDRGEGEPIALVACRDEHDEARTVVSEVQAAVARGESLADVAVFYRTNAQSRAIEDQLVRSGIPYTVIGGPRFYERAEIRDLLAYLRPVVNASDSVSLARALGVPKRGIGPACLARLNEFAQAHDIPIADTLEQVEAVPGLGPAQRATLSETAAILHELRQMDLAGSPIDRIIDHALDRSGIRAMLQAEGTLEAQGRLENLDELVSVAAEHSADRELGLGPFLEEIALQADADQVDQGAGALTLMTIHNAKGLEFDTVLITGLEEGLFPHARSDTPETLEEERRLFYVGITRARARLALTHAESRALHGARDYRLPSRFLAEIPPDAAKVPPGARAPVRMHQAVRPPSRAVSGASLATGDSVIHATFGEGVVTGVERNGDLVRVRFASDGAERRLMAGAAPMRKIAI